MNATARSTRLLLAVGLSGLLLSSGPVRPGGDDEALARGLGWLQKHMQGKAWLKPAGAMGNTAGKRHAATAIAGWVALSDEQGLVDPQVAKAWQARLARAAGGSGFNTAAFANWLDGMAGLYFVELALRETKSRRALRRIVAGFESRQNREGAWGHGMRGGGFYPSTLVAASNWALLTLGLAARQGCEVEPEVIDEALALYAKVQARNGSFPYGGLPYRKGYEAGRTSGSVVALLAVEKDQSPLFRRAAQYVRRNLVAVPNGHASPAMHVFMGALAAYALGEDDWKRYRSTVLVRVLACQQPDGSFDDIQGQSPDSFKLMGDDLTNRAYITALYTAALAVPYSRVARELKLDTPLPDPQPSPALTAATDPLWQVAPTEGETRGLVHAGDRVLLLKQDGQVHCFEAVSGKACPKESFRLGGGAKIASTKFFCHGDDVFMCVAPEVKMQMPGSMKEMFEASRKRRKNPGPRQQLARYSVAEHRLCWTKDLPAPLMRCAISSAGLHLLLFGGKVWSIDRDGNDLHEPFSGPALKANGAIARFENGQTVVAGESRLALFDSEGNQAWTCKMRSPRGVTPPAIGALVASGERVYAGLTSGEALCLSAQDGKKLWRVQTGAAIQRLQMVGTGARETLLALTYDGSLHGIRDGKLLWTADLTEGAEAPHGPTLAVGEASIWAGSSEASRLVEVDTASGQLSRRLVLAEGKHWSVGGGRLYMVSKQGLCCYRIDSGR